MNGVELGLQKQINTLVDEVAGLQSVESSASFTINVKWYGAKGDGTTNDTSAIQAAAAAMGAGDSLYFPAGYEFLLTDAIAITTARTHVIGYGAKLTQSGTEKAHIAVSAEYVTIEGLWLYNSRGGTDWNDSGSSGARGVTLTTAGYSKIINCRIENCGESSIWVVSGKGIEIRNNHLIGIGTTGGLSAGSNYNFGVNGNSSGSGKEGMRVVGNRFIDFAQGVFTAHDWEDLQISGNFFDNIVGQHAIYCDNAINLVITDNRINTTGQVGIKVQISSNTTADAENIVISGNTIVDATQQGIIVIPASAGLSYEFYNLVISNNTILNPGADGIIVDQAQAWQVVNNTIKDAGTFGIRCSAIDEPYDGVIARNTIINSTRNALYLKTVSTSYTIIIEDNLFIDPCRTPGGTSDLQAVMYLSTGDYIVRGNVLKQTSEPYTYLINLHSTATARIYENVWGSGNTKNHLLNGTHNDRDYRSVSGNRGDASVTLQVGVDAEVQRFETTLTANRTVTLSNTGATKGDRFRIVRKGLGAFTLDVGGLKTIPSSAAAFVDVVYHGGGWMYDAYGTL